MKDFFGTPFSRVAAVRGPLGQEGQPLNGPPEKTLIPHKVKGLGFWIKGFDAHTRTQQARLHIDKGF